MSEATLDGRIAAVQARLRAAAARAGRDPAGVVLIAVSKTFPPAAIRAAHAAGLRRFGESYAQELRDKARALADLELEWHFVGRLQRNKVKYVVGTAALVHSVDSEPLAQALSERAAAAGLRQRVLVEVGLAGEAQKGGVPEARLDRLLAALGRLPALEVAGLMTLPPFSEDPEASRPYFRRLAELARAHGLRELSMGMSLDLEVAVEEGATLVRVGTALFGERATP